MDHQFQCQCHIFKCHWVCKSFFLNFISEILLQKFCMHFLLSFYVCVWAITLSKCVTSPLSSCSVFRSQGSGVIGVERQYEWLPVIMWQTKEFVRVCMCVRVCVRDIKTEQERLKIKWRKTQSWRDFDRRKYERKQGTETHRPEKSKIK